MHPAARVGLAGETKLHHKVLKNIFQLAGELLPLFPKEEFGRRPRQSPAAAKVWHHKGGHCWHKISSKEGSDAAWACSKCLVVAATELLAKAMRACAGHPVLDNLRLNSLEHSIFMVVTTEGPVLVCNRCGAFASSVPRKLAEVCKGRKARGGVVTMSRIASGRHPEQRSSAPQC